MRKIIVGAMVSMDGVMQAPGAATEDPTNGFKFGGWQMPYFDQEFGEELAVSRTQELFVSVSSDGGRTYRELVRQGVQLQPTRHER